MRWRRAFHEKKVLGPSQLDELGRLRRRQDERLPNRSRVSFLFGGDACPRSSSLENARRTCLLAQDMLSGLERVLDVGKVLRVGRGDVDLPGFHSCVSQPEENALAQGQRLQSWVLYVRRRRPASERSDWERGRVRSVTSQPRPSHRQRPGIASPHLVPIELFVAPVCFDATLPSTRLRLVIERVVGDKRLGLGERSRGDGGERVGDVGHVATVRETKRAGRD